MGILTLIISALLIIAVIPSPKPVQTRRTVTTRVKIKTTPALSKSTEDEREYQRARLQHLYTLYDLAEKQLSDSRTDKQRESSVRKIMNIESQIRRAQKAL